MQFTASVPVYCTVGKVTLNTALPNTPVRGPKSWNSSTLPEGSLHWNVTDVGDRNVTTPHWGHAAPPEIYWCAPPSTEISNRGFYSPFSRVTNFLHWKPDWPRVSAPPSSLANDVGAFLQRDWLRALVWVWIQPITFIPGCCLFLLSNGLGWSSLWYITQWFVPLWKFTMRSIKQECWIQSRAWTLDTGKSNDYIIFIWITLL